MAAFIGFLRLDQKMSLKALDTALLKGLVPHKLEATMKHRQQASCDILASNTLMEVFVGFLQHSTQN